MEIFPLAITQPDWKLFIELCKEYLGFSPTRGLDESYLTVKDPAAYLACLSLDNKPMENLRKIPNITFNHYTISFLIICNEKEFKTKILFATVLPIVKKFDDDQYLIIVSGTLSQWLDIIHYDEDAEFAKKIINILSNTGFREIFHGC